MIHNILEKWDNTCESKYSVRRSLYCIISEYRNFTIKKHKISKHSLKVLLAGIGNYFQFLNSRLFRNEEKDFMLYVMLCYVNSIKFDVSFNILFCNKNRNKIKNN